MSLLSLVDETEKAYELQIEGLKEPLWVPKSLTLGVSYRDELVYIETWWLDKQEIFYLWTVDTTTLTPVLF